MVSCASPVPGGMSTTITSSVPHSTSRSIWVSADITIGPRQIIGVSSSTKNPIDITAMPWRTIGFSRVPPTVCGFSRMARSFGIDGP